MRKGATYEVIPQSYSDSGSSFLICSVPLINFSNYHSTALNIFVLHEFLCNKVCASSFRKESGTAALQPKDSNKHQKSNSLWRILPYFTEFIWSDERWTFKWWLFWTTVQLNRFFKELMLPAREQSHYALVLWRAESSTEQQTPKATKKHQWGGCKKR